MAEGYLVRQDDMEVIRRAVRRLETTPRNESGPNVSSDRMSWRRSYAIVTVINETDEDLEAFSIVQIRRDTPTYSNTTDTTKQKTWRTWVAEAPSGDEFAQYAVLQTDCAKNKRGQAILNGVTKVALDDSEEGSFAVPVEGSFTKFATSSGGRFPVLNVETAGSADTWGYVALVPAVSPAGRLFAVKVWKDGGTTDGDSSNQCDATYTVRTLAATANDTGGEELGTAMTPEKRRPSYGGLDVPSETGSGEIGQGYFDADGTFHLYDANETLDPTNCET